MVTPVLISMTLEVIIRKVLGVIILRDHGVMVYQVRTALASYCREFIFNPPLRKINV